MPLACCISSALTSNLIAMLRSVSPDWMVYTMGVGVRVGVGEGDGDAGAGVEVGRGVEVAGCVGDSVAAAIARVGGGGGVITCPHPPSSSAHAAAMKNATDIAETDTLCPRNPIIGV